MKTFVKTLTVGVFSLLAFPETPGALKSLNRKKPSPDRKRIGKYIKYQKFQAKQLIFGKVKSS